VKRVIVLSSLVTSAVWVMMTAVSMTVIFPAVVDAQISRIAADDLIVGPADGPRVHLAVVQPGPQPQVQVVGANGQVRAALSTGGPSNQPNPATAGLNIMAEDGQTIIGRIGTTSAGTSTEILLRDRQGNIRFITIVDDNGNPSIQLLDAVGNVIWSAP
jgi:hypothetical protein